MADNRIDFMHAGEKYFAEQCKLVDLRNDDPEKDKGFVIVYDIMTLPKGCKMNDVVAKDREKIFPIAAPKGFMYFIGKYPKEQ